MIKTFAVALALALVPAVLLSSARAEDFKGRPAPHEWDFSGSLGLGIVDSSGAFALTGAAARRIVEKGFVPDLNNQVFVELELGPAFFSGTAAFVYSMHLRWDFQKDDTWTFFALGGLAGNASGSGVFNRWTLHPRFGAGAFYRLNSLLRLRGEVSHELTTVGVAFAL